MITIKRPTLIMKLLFEWLGEKYKENVSPITTEKIAAMQNKKIKIALFRLSGRKRLQELLPEDLIRWGKVLHDYKIW
mgnify:CR=1 FL=1